MSETLRLEVDAEEAGALYSLLWHAMYECDPHLNKLARPTRNALKEFVLSTQPPSTQPDRDEGALSEAQITQGVYGA